MTRPYGVYGARLDLALTPTDLKLIRSWSKADKVTASRVVTELIGREDLRRRGLVTVIVNDATEHERRLSQPKGRRR